MLSYKVLGDMLEAIIGAIFVDSGGATSIVTGVIYLLLGREFGMSCCCSLCACMGGTCSVSKEF